MVHCDHCVLINVKSIYVDHLLFFTFSRIRYQYSVYSSLFFLSFLITFFFFLQRNKKKKCKSWTEGERNERKKKNKKKEPKLED